MHNDGQGGHELALSCLLNRSAPLYSFVYNLTLGPQHLLMANKISQIFIYFYPKFRRKGKDLERIVIFTSDESIYESHSVKN